jgi:hypothetical protein
MNKSNKAQTKRPASRAGVASGIGYGPRVPTLVAKYYALRFNSRDCQPDSLSYFIQRIFE